MRVIAIGLGVALVVAAGAVVAVLVLGGDESSSGPCYRGDLGPHYPVDCDAPQAVHYSEDTTLPTSEAGPSQQEITSAYGKLFGWCIAEQHLGSSGYRQRDQARTNLERLIEAAQADPEALDADGNTIRQDLYDAAGELKRCDQGLYVEAQDAIDSLP